MKTSPVDTKAFSEKNLIVETLRNSQLAAANEFEIKKLGRPQAGFLDCSIEEEKESLTVRYDIHNVLSWINIRKERRELMISALIDAGKLWL